MDLLDGLLNAERDKPVKVKLEDLSRSKYFPLQLTQIMVGKKVYPGA